MPPATSEPDPARGASLRRRIAAAGARFGFGHGWWLIILGAIVGTFTGFGAVGFAAALHWVSEWSTEFQTHTSIWLIPLAPMVGALVTGLLVHYFASDARGHGVPQVMTAVIERGGKIRPRVGIAKILASISTVGSGGSAGAEGPIIQIGATAGSAVGQALHVSREQMHTLLGCGAAAGIAAVFNAPIAGVFFVLEILLRDFTLRTFTPIVVASVFSNIAMQLSLGRNEAIFASPQLLQGYGFNPMETPAFILLGVVCAVVAVGFSRLLAMFEDLFERMHIGPVWRPVLGAALLGVLGIGYVLLRKAMGGPGHESAVPFFGNGYDTIRALLNPDYYHPESRAGRLPGVTGVSVVESGLSLMLILLLCKALGTALTLGSGGSGGVFAPSLFLGSAAGAALGIMLERLGLIEGGTPATYALVGMAGLVAAGTHAPLTAILIVFELTRDVYVLVPVMLTAVLATLVAQFLNRDSIYTLPLRRRGLIIGGPELATMRRLPLSTVTLSPLPPEPIYPSDPLSKLITLHSTLHIPDFAVVDQKGRYVGMVSWRDIRTALIDREAIPLLLVAELLRSDLPTISADEHLDTVFAKFARTDAEALIVLDGSSRAAKPRGILTRAELLRAYQAAINEF